MRAYTANALQKETAGSREVWPTSGVLEMDFPDLALKRVGESVTGKPVDVIRFIGKITHENSPTVNRKIYRILEGQHYNIILDLSKLEYINSSGVAILFHVLSIVKQHQGKVLIGGVHRFLGSVFNLMDLPPDMEMYGSLDDARQAFADFLAT